MRKGGKEEEEAVGKNFQTVMRTWFTVSLSPINQLGFQYNPDCVCNCMQFMLLKVRKNGKQWFTYSAVKFYIAKCRYCSYILESLINGIWTLLRSSSDALQSVLHWGLVEELGALRFSSQNCQADISQCISSWVLQWDQAFLQPKHWVHLVLHI